MKIIMGSLYGFGMRIWDQFADSSYRFKNQGRLFKSDVEYFNRWEQQIEDLNSKIIYDWEKKKLYDIECVLRAGSSGSRISPFIELIIATKRSVIEKQTKLRNPDIASV